MIVSDMQVNGWKRLLPESLSKMRCVLAARMGNIAGSWTAECRSEMKMETSSSGMGLRPTSKIANAPRKRFSKANFISLRGNAWRTWEVGHSILQVFLIIGLRNCFEFTDWIRRREPRHL